MKDWLESLGERERLLVITAAAVILLTLVYTLLWSPLQDGYTQMRETVTAQRETARWMEQSAQRLKALRSNSAGATRGLGGKSLLALADSSARSQGLATALKRVEPEGSNSVKVWLEDAAFDTTIEWLAGLGTGYGIHADTVTMESVPGNTGRVNARLTLMAPEQ